MTGTLRGGSSSSLSGDDTSYYQVSSSTSGQRTASWYGAMGNVPKSLVSLQVNYRGSNSVSASQQLSIWNWSTSAWVTLDTRTVGAAEVQIAANPTGTLANYVSGTSGAGQVRTRVSNTNPTAAFFTSGDLLNIAYR